MSRIAETIIFALISGMLLAFASRRWRADED